MPYTPQVGERYTRKGSQDPSLDRSCFKGFSRRLHALLTPVWSRPTKRPVSETPSPRGRSE